MVLPRDVLIERRHERTYRRFGLDRLARQPPQDLIAQRLGRRGLEPRDALGLSHGVLNDNGRRAQQPLEHTAPDPDVLELGVDERFMGAAEDSGLQRDALRPKIDAISPCPQIADEAIRREQQGEKGPTRDATYHVD